MLAALGTEAASRLRISKPPHFSSAFIERNLSLRVITSTGSFLSVRANIASKIVAQNTSTERTSVYEVMTKPALAVDVDMNIKYAIRLLSSFQLTRALVTQGGELVGIVTLRDMVLGYVDGQETATQAQE